MTVLRRTCLDESCGVLGGPPYRENLIARGAFKGLKIPVSVVRFRPWAPTSPESSWHGSFLPNALACSALFGPADCCMCGHWTLRRGEHVATDHRKWIGAGAERRLLKGRRLQRGSDMREPGLRLATAIPIGTRSARANTSAGNIGSTPRGVLSASASWLVPAARHRIRIPYRQHV